MESDGQIVLKALLDVTKTAMEVDAGEEVVLGLLNLCEKAIELRKEVKPKRMWALPWRAKKNDKGSFAFLTKELALTDSTSYNNYIRMDQPQFDFILSLIKRNIERSDSQMRQSIYTAERLAVTLRFLATGESFKSLNYQTRISTTLISQIVPEVCDAIYKQLKNLYLKVPQGATEWEQVAKEFALKWQFPNCIGALDGKHITFRPQRKQGALYHNYKGTNSIILLALVDANCQFIFIDVGANGRTNDAGVLQQSHLKRILDEEDNLPLNSVVGRGRNLPYVVVADDAFPLHKHIMKPYPFGTNSKEKQVFNARLSRARHVVEHAFGILSNRFRVFLKPMAVKVESVEKITLATIALHNFILNHNKAYLTSYTTEGAPSTNVDTEVPYNPRRGQAETIRQQFTEYFNNEGKLD